MNKKATCNILFLKINFLDAFVWQYVIEYSICKSVIYNILKILKMQEGNVKLIKSLLCQVHDVMCIYTVYWLSVLSVQHAIRFGI